MTDFKELREALDAVPLPHNWSVCRKAPNDQWYAGTTIGASDPNDARRVADTCRLRADAGLFADYIAAANPAVIRSLLDRLEAAERDAGRYRKLKASGKYCAASIGGGWGLSCGNGPRTSDKALDAAIDAMKEQQP